MNKKNQLKNVVILRTFAIMAVVLYHCFCPFFGGWNWYTCEISAEYSYIFNYLLAGRMPLFFFISGFLFSHLILDRGKYQDFSSFIVNKTTRLLVPCLTFSAIMCFVLKGDFFSNLLFDGYHLWFLKTLYLCFIICWGSNRLANNYIQDVIIWIGALLMMALPSISVYFIVMFCKRFVFFYTGYLIYKYRQHFSILFHRKGAALFLSLYIVIAFIGFYIYNDNEWKTDFDYYTVIFLSVIEEIAIGFLTIAFVFSSVNTLLNKYPNFHSRFFTQINDVSYGIYLFHVFFLYALRMYCDSFLGFFASHYILTPIILFFIIMGFSILCTKIIKRASFGKYIVG